MANNWCELTPNLVDHDFEIYDNCSTSMDMSHFHGHSFYEFRLILSGGVLHYSENTTCNLGPGDVSVLPPGLFHRTYRQKEKEMSTYARVLVYVSTDFVRSLSSESLNLAEIFDDFGYPGIHSLHLDKHELSTWAQPLQDIVRANKDDDPLRHLHNKAQVTLFLVRIAEKIIQTRVSSTQPDEASLVQRVIAYINANLSENLSLDSLSERFFVSKFYLSHQFKQYTQLSLHQYVLTRRMMHAQILLRSGQSPSDVAAACGYHEYSSFYKAFLRETGQSPRDFS